MRMTLTMLAVFFAAAAMKTTDVVAESGGIGIAAVVDDQVISTVDFNDRIALVMGMTNIADTSENRARIAPQILHQLVDEKLQMQEATRDGITVSDAKLKEGITRIEKQSGKVPGSLEQYLEAKGLSKLSLYAQIRAQIAWSEIILKKVRSHVHISDREVESYINRKVPPPVAAANAAPIPQGKIEEVLISAIHIPVDAPSREGAVQKLAQKLAGEIRSGASFEAVATQFSSSANGAKATTPFWVEMAQIDPAIAAALTKTAKGGITDPVRTSTGYQIIKLIDLRQAKASESAGDTLEKTKPEQQSELAFKQILMTLKPDAKPKEAELLLRLAKDVQQAPGKCEEKSMAGAGDLSDMDFRVTLTRANSGDLPEKLRDFLMKLKVGAASDPVITPQGIRLFMLCERIDLPNAKPAPTASDDAARQAIYEEKMEMEAQKYMRDLRRQAFIEVRGAE